MLFSVKRTSQIRHSVLPTASSTSYCAPQPLQMTRSSLVARVGLAVGMSASVVWVR